jgi:hypothetical protein
VPWQRLAAEQEQQQQQQWNPRQLEQRLQQWEQQRQQQQRLKIVVFIDDLDRCRPNKVVEVLEAINVVLGPSGFTVVAGMVRLLLSLLSMPLSAYASMGMGSCRDLCAGS